MQASVGISFSVSTLQREQVTTDCVMTSMLHLSSLPMYARCGKCTAKTEANPSLLSRWERQGTHRIVARRARREIQNVPSVFFLLGNSFSEKTPIPVLQPRPAHSDPFPRSYS